MFTQYQVYSKQNADIASKAFLKESLKSKFVDIQLDSLQIKKLNNYLNETPIKKKWVKANIQINGKNLNGKIKYHGTSSSHYVNNKYSYAIKLKKDSTYINNARKFKLIKSEEADPSVLVINKLAHDAGLISTYGDMKILRINGIESVLIT